MIHLHAEKIEPYQGNRGVQGIALGTFCKFSSRLRAVLARLMVDLKVLLTVRVNFVQGYFAQYSGVFYEGCRMHVVQGAYCSSIQ